MFENMSQRERILALIVATTLPLALLVWGFTTFSSTYFSRQAKLRDLDAEIEREKDRRFSAEEAKRRRLYYRQRSLPTDLNTSRIQYDAWLTEVIEKRAGMVATSIDGGRSNSNKVRYMQGNKPVDVFEEVSIKVRCSGTIGQLMTALSEFYKLDMMHRISSLTITPIARVGSGAGSEVLTGQLKIEFDISAISLADGDREGEFVTELARDSLSFAEFTNPILGRNIFGPANNTPTVSSSSRSFETGEPFELTLTADDADENDQLKIELLDSEVAGAELNQKEGDRRARVSIPALDEEGRFEIKVRVTDNGFPAKSTEKTIAFNVDKPEPKVTREEPKPKPQFKHAKATVIRGVVRDKSGDEVCWIEVESLGKSYRLKVGESFELDDKTWTLKKVESRRVSLEVDGNLQTYRLGARLDSPEGSVQDVKDVKETVARDDAGDQ